MTVTAATANGTATAPADYTANSVALTFAPGETTKNVVVQVAGDVLDEPDETFTMGLTGAGNATVGDGSGLGTIIDDDLAPITSPPAVNGSDLFCGTQARGQCAGIKFKESFDRPGNASWKFAAYNPTPGKSGRAHTAAARTLVSARSDGSSRRRGRCPSSSGSRSRPGRRRCS